MPCKVRCDELRLHWSAPSMSAVLQGCADLFPELPQAMHFGLSTLTRCCVRLPLLQLCVHLAASHEAVEGDRHALCPRSSRRSLGRAPTISAWASATAALKASLSLLPVFMLWRRALFSKGGESRNLGEDDSVTVSEGSLTACARAEPVAPSPVQADFSAA
jgi:hypothetical protein